jgi:hypothetical protein
MSGRYFNKGVKCLDSPHVGHVVRETSDKIVVFGEGDDRYDIPKEMIRFAAANVLVDLPFHEIVKNFKVSREEPLPIDKARVHSTKMPEPADLATYEGKYPTSLFNKGVRTQDEEHVGHVMTEAGDKIVIWGHYNWRFDVPRSKIIAVGRNVILGMDYDEVFKYKIDRNSTLPTGEPVENLGTLYLPFEVSSEEFKDDQRAE